MLATIIQYVIIGFGFGIGFALGTGLVGAVLSLTNRKGNK